MLEKGKKEKKEEQLQFNSYKQWCEETITEKTRDIDEANELIEILKADIQKYAADIETLTKEIAVHDEDISTWNRDIKAATKVREIEKADYDANHKDYTESIDALERAIEVLKKSSRGQAFFQVSAKLKNLNLIPPEDKKAIDTMLAQYTEEALDLESAAPEAAAYEYQSHGIIDMLEKLLNKFVDELAQMEKDEKESLHGFTMLMQ